MAEHGRSHQSQGGLSGFETPNIGWRKCPPMIQCGIHSTSLARENETGRRPMREQSTAGVRDVAFLCANTTATVEDLALGPDRIGIQRDGPDKRNFKFERGA